MQLLTFFLSLLWAGIVYGTTPTLSSSAIATKREHRIGLQTTNYPLIAPKLWPASLVRSDSIAPSDAYHRGRQDARLFYRHRGAFWIPFGLTVSALTVPAALALPGVGTGLYFLPGLGSSLYQGLTTPDEKKLKRHDVRYRNPALLEATDQLFQDDQYVKGYQRGSRRRKLGQATVGFAAGLGTTFLIVVVFAAAAMSGG